ncbi:SH3 domain-containing protein [Candidatus Avelusimicrobium gallicola]|uniref:SH3b domain-containing protein n=1 Tax=Candidatus Avelusimicrobium gallicola TaxID=2562704 RepID=A0A1Y4DF67_9BACT|nr:SH3 domain-containing protein [Elusimicrobium sp. An273]OUO57292.1 hypothetical protein B5F75_00495 [Elusimicrobium sp. An273]
MKRFLALTLLLVSVASAAWAQTALEQAENFYRQGKFSAALGIYESELKKVPNDPYLYYNIGNCYFKMGSRGLAIANYYRAFRLAPRDADIRHNLTLSLSSVGERLVPSGVPVVLHQAFYSLSYSELKGLLFALLWLFCALASLWLLKRKWGRMLAASAVILLLCAGWFYLRHTLQVEHLAVIAAPVAEIRSGPGTNFPASASLAQGHLITVEDAKDEWYEVIVKSQGLKGWVEKSAVEQI